MIGQKLGNYRVTERLGQGGMGVVYIGEHELMGNKVAIKVLLPEYCHKQDVVQRFFNEAKAATHIDHPGIVKVFDFGEHSDGSNYIIMEFLAGESLARRLKRRGPIPLDASLRLLQQCAGILEAAHQSGIVHRDLKPDNIFLCPDPDMTGGERVKLLDFGVAKLVDDFSTGAGSTKSGAVIGTPRFMSPEQCAGDSKTVDHRADLYALGCVAFAMLCGRPPFLQQGFGQILSAHMFLTPPRASSIEPSLPASIDELLAALLAKDPDERYHSAADVARAFEDIARDGAISVRPAGRRPPSKARVTRPRGGDGGGDVLAVATTLGGASASMPGSASGERGKSPRWLWLAGGGLALVVLAGAALVSWTSDGADTKPGRDTAASAASSNSPETADDNQDSNNRWVRIEPPPAGTPLILGVSAKTAKDIPKALGLRPERKVRAPQVPFAVQQHEVTWAELQPWLDDHPDMVVHPPRWLPESAEQRARLPATGLPWTTAQAYCAALDGRLPTEAEWEYAARGPELRPYSWGSQRLDRFRTHAYAGKDSQLVPVMSKDQDRTPGTLERSLYDMMGNAQEWTADLWRNDAPGGDESWVQDGDSTYRAVRGLSPHAPPPGVLPREGAAYRDALCATPACIKGSEHLLGTVGVRCARDVRGDGP